MGHPDSITPAPSNVIHLADFRVPSWRRRGRGAAPTDSAWAAMARQRAGAPEQAAATGQPSTNVRVTHFPEAANGGGVARLRISGRLADVCAELDRLAEVEARASMRRA